MSRPFKLFDNTLKTVEPTRRWVGGRFGWAYHRYPIKGGITPMEAMRITMTEQLETQIRKRSYFFPLIEAGVIATLPRK